MAKVQLSFPTMLPNYRNYSHLVKLCYLPWLTIQFELNCNFIDKELFEKLDSACGETTVINLFYDVCMIALNC